MLQLQLSFRGADVNLFRWSKLFLLLLEFRVIMALRVFCADEFGFYVMSSNLNLQKHESQPKRLYCECVQYLLFDEALLYFRKFRNFRFT